MNVDLTASINDLLESNRLHIGMDLGPFVPLPPVTPPPITAIRHQATPRHTHLIIIISYGYTHHHTYLHYVSTLRTDTLKVPPHCALRALDAAISKVPPTLAKQAESYGANAEHWRRLA
ncbi:hypothetical protein JMJ77_0009219 [Colletotrichum scovillei]|uniref:Uncharacterized protein n=1 Tax=Colletotrichum scovillei TaxID=1209932 RepID=A0A9P7U7L0_9PEZI|nr:hypothetical protein JMJ77_0009219 [Colletotrichum scovillei]KAG7052294.1 hypothetical protein JMJ78_0005315 [Colletotrichum scovillei]KAG7064585.1 hypothetical protein JMJ76_0012348 [Colletotrichum scovillei]